MSVAIQIEMQDGGVLAALSRLAMADNTKRDLLDLIGITEAENTRLRFVDQRGPDGQPWEQSIRVKKQGGQTLRDTGRLMNSITHKTGNDLVEVGTNVMYAAMMHYGGAITATGGGYLKFRIAGAWMQKRSVTIPPRPFLGLDANSELQIIDVINQFMQLRM